MACRHPPQRDHLRLTHKSKGASEINSNDWYEVLARKRVEIGRSNPDTGPSGYQTVQMLNLANRYYKDPNIETGVLANAPFGNMRDTETSLISATRIAIAANLKHRE